MAFPRALLNEAVEIAIWTESLVRSGSCEYSRGIWSVAAGHRLLDKTLDGGVEPDTGCSIDGLSYSNTMATMKNDMKISRQAAPLRHLVQEAIRKEIATGRLSPGQRLVEQQLCTALDVSRTVLREALRQLEAEGLVEMIPHRGAVVASIDLDEARQIYEVRGGLEALAVAGFVVHATDADLQKLQGVLRQLEEAEQSEPTGQELLALKKRFYDVLLVGCGNDVIRQLIGQLNNRISFLRSISLSRAGRLSGTVREIRAIVEALQRRDPEAASAAARTHVENASRNALETLRARMETIDESVRQKTGSNG